MRYLPIALLLTATAAAEERILDGDLHHLRIDGPREWSEFPEEPHADHLEIRFEGRSNDDMVSLRLRQHDVKQTWNVLLNGKSVGRLPTDENDMIVYFDLAPGLLVDGENKLRIEQDTRRHETPDDVRIGEIAFDRRQRGTVQVHVVDHDSGERLPARITVLNQRGALQSVSAQSDDHLAVRPGTIYTSDGEATFESPPGLYTLYAGRGFEYSLASDEVEVSSGQTVTTTLRIRREVPTEGYVACDTHVHTRTHSGHGDATVQERMITLAAEGIELPIATDHNAHIDHDPFARDMNVRQYFTPVIGNEVTTPTGHFNIFPVEAGAPIPPFKNREWRATLDGIYATPGVRVAILNHARDLHGGTRPFGPKLFNEAVGENLEGWHMGFNAMEVINSGATQTDVLQLFRDWMALLNRGLDVTPVGSSDSHDVARHFVGQGRTYIRCDDSDPGSIDVDEAVESFVQGRVMVSYGLLSEITVNDEHRVGDLVPLADNENTVNVTVRVLGPHWTSVDEVLLFSNGHEIDRKRLTKSKRSETGVLWEGNYEITRPKHDAHLVAIALGPGVEGLYWKTAKPYQPTSPDWTPRVIGCSGAIWIDADGDGKRTSAREYAERLMKDMPEPSLDYFRALEEYDAAVSAQAAHLLQSRGVSLVEGDVARVLDDASGPTALGFRRYVAAWRKSELARGER